MFVRYVGHNSPGEHMHASFWQCWLWVVPCVRACTCVGVYMLCVCVWWTNYCSGVDMYQLCVHISVDMNQLPYIYVSTSSNSSTHMYSHVPPTVHRCRQKPTRAHICYAGGIRVTHIPTTVHICVDMYHQLYTGVDKSQLGHTYVIRVG